MKEQAWDGQRLSPDDTIRCRRMAATANFLAMRGIMFCGKDLTRHMATPTTAVWEQVVRLGRYLKNTPGYFVVVQVPREAVPT